MVGEVEVKHLFRDAFKKFGKIVEVGLVDRILTIIEMES